MSGFTSVHSDPHNDLDDRFDPDLYDKLLRRSGQTHILDHTDDTGMDLPASDLYDDLILTFLPTPLRHPTPKSYPPLFLRERSSTPREINPSRLNKKQLQVRLHKERELDIEGAIAQLRGNLDLTQDQ